MRELIAIALAALLLAGCGSRSGLWRPSWREAGERDGSPPDAPGDAPRSDLLLAREQPRPDAALPPCGGASGQVVKSFSEKMVVCRGLPESWVDQCHASKLCGKGWRLCGASEYQARFGVSAAPPGTETSWIGACVRSGGAPHAPTDQPCAQCPTEVVNPTGLVAWLCFKDGAGMVQRSWVGVASHPDCYRVGVNSATTAAYWSASSPDYKLRQAFCCKS